MMFKSLKEKIGTEVNRTKQTLYSSIIANDSGLTSKNSEIRTSSSSSRDENLETNRSRLDSASSDISQTVNYVPASRQFIPPSDIESEYGGEESDHETNSKMRKLFDIYKNKYAQLKNAYAELEKEKDHIKEVLQKSQDVSIKRQAELREKIKLERQAKEQSDKEINSRDNQIEELIRQLSNQQDLSQTDQEEIRTLRENNTRLEGILVQCTEKIKTHREKQVDLIKERDNLLQQLNESMINHIEDSSLEVKQNFNSDISVLLHDKEQLHKQQIEILKQNLVTENEQHLKAFETLKTEYENLTNELHQTKQVKDNIQSLLDQTQKNQHTDDEIDQLKAILTKLQHDYDESIANCTQLTQTIDIQREEHLKELARIKNEQQIQFDNNLKELREEDNRVKSQIENQHKKAIEILQIELENTRKEKLSVSEDELNAIAKRAEDKTTDLSSQINEYQQEINRLQQLLDEQKNNSNQYEEKLKEKSSQIIQFEKDLEKFDLKTKQLQNELDVKQNEIIQLNTSIKEYEQSRQTIEISQSNDQQLLEQKDQMIDTLKQDHQLQIDKYSQLETKLNNILSEKSELENELDCIRLRIQTTESTLNEKANNHSLQLEQTIKEFETERDSYRNEIEKLKSQSQEKFDLTTKQLQNELDEKTSYINNIKEQLDVKQNEIIQLNTTIKEYEQSRQTIEISQSNDQQLLEQKDQIIDTLKQDHQLQIDKYSQLETKLNNILSEKSELENELDSIRLRIQTTESTLNEKTNDHSLQLEQTIKEFETERDSYRNEIEKLKSEIISLVNTNEENTRRIDEFDNEKFNFEQEINEKDRQITERDEKIQDIELTLEQTKESRDKLRKALQKKNESMNNNEKTDSQDAEIRLRKATEKYEERLKEQQVEYDAKLKSIAKEMNAQINEKEENYNQQLNDFIQQKYKSENDRINHAEQRANVTEQKLLIAEKQVWKMEEELKEKQLDYYRILQDLQNQIQKLTKEKPQTTENFSQTVIEDLRCSNDSQNSLIFEPTEVDYLKTIILAYMTGTDRITMVKVICAVLHYTDDETSLILEHEKLRQSRWLNSTR